MTAPVRHLFEPGPNPLRCRHCGQPRYSSIRGTDPYHKRDPKGFNGREAYKR